MAHIMVVDDERDVVSLISFLLERDGHQVTEAFNGAEALEKLGIEPPSSGTATPDLIILDVMMPVMDGYSVTARLVEDPEARRIPLVVLTARGQMKDLFQLSANVAAYLEKPFDPKRLRETVGSVLQKK